MIELNNGIKPSEVTTHGTYLAVHSKDSDNPGKRMLIVDVWVDAKGKFRTLNGNSLIELTTYTPDTLYTLYGPIDVPQVETLTEVHE